MSKTVKMTLAAVLTVLTLGGAAPAALADGQKSVGTRAYERFVHVTQTTGGKVALRVIDHVAGTVRP